MHVLTNVSACTFTVLHSYCISVQMETSSDAIGIHLRGHVKAQEGDFSISRALNLFTCITVNSMTLFIVKNKHGHMLCCDADLMFLLPSSASNTCYFNSFIVSYCNSVSVLQSPCRDPSVAPIN